MYLPIKIEAVNGLVIWCAVCSLICFGCVVLAVVTGHWAIFVVQSLLTLAIAAFAWINYQDNLEEL